MDGTTESFPDTVVAHAVIDGNGTAGDAVLITNDTYRDNSGVTQETQETISLGSRNNANVGTGAQVQQRHDAFTFWPQQLPHQLRLRRPQRRHGQSVRHRGRGLQRLRQCRQAAPTSGGPSLYATTRPRRVPTSTASSGQASDFAYHYSANSKRQPRASRASRSATVDTDQNPQRPTMRHAILLQCRRRLPPEHRRFQAPRPGLHRVFSMDDLRGQTATHGLRRRRHTVRHVQSRTATAACHEFDAAYGSALIYAQSFVGGTDTAVNNAYSINIITGFNNQSGNGNGSVLADGR